MPFIRKLKNERFEELKILCESFGKNRKRYKSVEYLEANCRIEFIDKFLEILNWDIKNENGFAPKYKEVILEAKTDVKGISTRPDYALCIGGNPVIFVEAKPPSSKLLTADEYALQLRKYAFSAKMPLSVLTDFDEFCVYDTRRSPKEKDTADSHRIKYITYDKFTDEFDYLWDTFSYDSVIHGSLDSYFDKDDGNYERNDVDSEILDAVEEWRIRFSEGAEKNRWVLDERSFNTAVQRLVNRFVHVWRTKGY